MEESDTVSGNISFVKCMESPVAHTAAQKIVIRVESRKSKPLLLLKIQIELIVKVTYEYVLCLTDDMIKQSGIPCGYELQE